jgi:predicted permease
VKNNANSDTATLSHRQQSAPRIIVSGLLWVLLPLHVLRKLYSDSEDSYVPVGGIE